MTEKDIELKLDEEYTKKERKAIRDMYVKKFNEEPARLATWIIGEAILNNKKLLSLKDFNELMEKYPDMYITREGERLPLIDVSFLNCGGDSSEEHEKTIYSMYMKKFKEKPAMKKSEILIRAIVRNEEVISAKTSKELMRKPGVCIM